MSERELTYGQALKEAIAEEMRRDSHVFLLGEDVAAGLPFKILTGLVQEFGTGRIIDKPISEPDYARHRRRRRMIGMRTGRRRDVRRLHHLDDGRDGQPGCQGSLQCRAARSRCRAHRRHKRPLAERVAPLPASAGRSRGPSPDTGRRVRAPEMASSDHYVKVFVRTSTSIPRVVRFRSASAGVTASWCNMLDHRASHRRSLAQ
jgi:hypothetical protein